MLRKNHIIFDISSVEQNENMYIDSNKHTIKIQ